MNGANDPSPQYVKTIGALLKSSSDSEAVAHGEARKARTGQVSVKAISDLLKSSSDPEDIAYAEARKARFRTEGYTVTARVPADGVTHKYGRKMYDI
jgi:hypothetical protein